MIKKQITNELTNILKDMGIHDVSVQVDSPLDMNHGDYTTNIAMIVAKRLGKNPRGLAEEMQSKLQMNKLLKKIEIAGPGFINLWLDDPVLIEQALTPVSFTQSGNKRHVVVEYSSPNIAKPFTVGHLRSTIIGDAVANLLEAVGYTVHRDNHLGDWGTQFGKQIYAIKSWGSESEIEHAERPVKVLVDLYVKFHQEAEKDPALEDQAREWFKKLEDGDAEARRLWQKCIDWSWKEFDAIYKELDVSFTENVGKGYGESYFEDKMQPVIDELREQGLLTEGKEGAQIVSFGDETKLPPLMILKKDGASLYATRDLATDMFRIQTYGNDVLIINEVGIEQELYFRQLYKLEELLGWIKPTQRVHVKHGHYRFKEGKMSTRKGNVIWLEDVLDEAVKRADALSSDKGSHVAQEVGLGALKWNDLKRNSEQDIVFDWEDILSMEGNSGPYVQYAYARTQSILSKAESLTHILKTYGELYPEEREVLLLISRFDETVQEAAYRYSPHIVANYLFTVAQRFNLFYQKYPILKADESTKVFRLELTKAVGNILRDGLQLLGIKAPQKM